MEKDTVLSYTLRNLHVLITMCAVNAFVGYSLRGCKNFWIIFGITFVLAINYLIVTNKYREWRRQGG